MRVVVRKERPHHGAELRVSHHDGLRLTRFFTITAHGHLPDLELRHRRRARRKDSIRTTKESGLQIFPRRGFDWNRIWLAILRLACELTAWTQMLAFGADLARGWEPKRQRLRVFSIAGRISRNARRTHLGLSGRAHHASTYWRPDSDTSRRCRRRPDQHQLAQSERRGHPPAFGAMDPDSTRPSRALACWPMAGSPAEVHNPKQLRSCTRDSRRIEVRSS
ncbi:hypothetical protein ERC79_08330 [Rhodococcus sp. ABRD24]|nr:hypothetical protein ERC79_08330 [Rhodococcus sp. ABRD24]